MREMQAKLRNDNASERVSCVHNPLAKNNTVRQAGAGRVAFEAVCVWRRMKLWMGWAVYVGRKC